MENVFLLRYFRVVALIIFNKMDDRVNGPVSSGDAGSDHFEVFGEKYPPFRDEGVSGAATRPAV
jgi:hypothetical protein